jgi:CelD/BcsL family acetyltransferase involved in cellulose biosynthesis
MDGSACFYRGTLLDVGSTAVTRGLTLETISGDAAFGRLAQEWDDLVRAMPRPSPVLLHCWLREWWRHYGRDGTLAVHVARRDGKLVGALPLCIRPRFGLQVLTFLGGDQSTLADLLIHPSENGNLAAALVQRAAAGPHDFADFFGLPAGSRLVAELGPSQLRLIERVEAPVLDLDGDFEAFYRERLTSKKRNQHKRRRSQLERLGRVEVAVARTPDELTTAIEDAFQLHVLRWNGRPDGSRFATPTGMRFHRAAVRSLGELDVARIVTLKLDGRAIAFHYFFSLERRMYVHRIAFDPSFSRYSPGILNTLDAVRVGTDEGAKRVEFLGGADRYKLELTDRLEPLHEGLGLARTLRGSGAVAARVRVIRMRKRLKRSSTLRQFYIDGLAPARRAMGRLR